MRSVPDNPPDIALSAILPAFRGDPGRAKAARHDAHDVINVVVQAQSFADNVRVGSEFPPPEPVADHDLQVVAGSGIVRIECAAQLRVYTEDSEVIRRNVLEAETLGLCAAGEF